jgi:hypothetical protein
MTGKQPVRYRPQPTLPSATWASAAFPGNVITPR